MTTAPRNLPKTPSSGKARAGEDTGPYMEGAGRPVSGLYGPNSEFQILRIAMSFPLREAHRSAADMTDDMKPKHSLFLIILLLITYACSLFDLWYTLHALEFVPGAEEMNPVFRMALDHPQFLVIYKHALFPLGLYILYRCRERAVARVGIYLATALFVVNTAYQLLMLPRWA